MHLAGSGCGGAVNLPKPLCSDGIDNDEGGYIDLADPGCRSADDGEEVPPNAVAACKDGFDNDNDGLVDLTDPHCLNKPNSLVDTRRRRRNAQPGHF